MIWTNEEFTKLKNKDPILLKKFYDIYKEKIYNYIFFKIKKDHPLIHDLFNDIFHSAILNISKLNHNNISGWLFNITKRRVNDHLRKHYREEKYLNKLYQDEAYSIDYVEDIYNKERVLQLQVAMGKIKPKYLEIIKLKYIERLSLKEIAEKTGKNTKAVESLLFRAKATLKNELESASKYF